MNLAEILASLQQQPSYGAKGLLQPVNDPYSAIKKGLLGDAGGPTEGARLYEGGANPRTLYHGTNREFSQFNTVNPKRNVGSADLEQKYGGTSWLSGSPQTARVYGKNVREVEVNPGKTETFDVQKLIRDPKFQDELRQTVFDDWAARGTLKGRRESPEELFQKHILEPALNPEGTKEGVPFSSQISGTLVRLARAKGLDTASVRGFREQGGAEQFMLLNPDMAQMRPLSQILQEKLK